MDIRLDGKDWQLIHLLPTEWVWRQVWKEDWDPQQPAAAGQWIQGTVPGDVISDAQDAGLIPDPYVDMQSRSCEWTSERDWLYRKTFTVPAEMQGKTMRLHFDGVDYTCHVYLNGEWLGKHEGMFTPFEFDVTNRIRHDQSNTLLVVVEHKPPVEAVQGQIGWTREARIWKSRFAYNWDWCTRLVPVGIWQSVRLIATEGAWLSDVHIRSQIYETAATVEVQVGMKASNNAVTSAQLRLRVTNPLGHTVAEPQEVTAQLNTVVDGAVGDYVFRLDINTPQLWYPNGMGEQPLYKARVDVLGSTGEASDTREVSFGLRTIRATPNEGAPADALPYTIEVNGRRMFVKGWNWSPIDNLYGRPQLERYERLLTLVKHANANLLRVWGGGLLEREAFYDLCDRFGILVWQEFHHSSSGIQNAPPEDEAYLTYIEAQARQMIPLRRNHPSLAIWCGGNELMDDNWVPLGDAHPALARLKSIVTELDPERLWLPTSSSGPVEGADIKLTGTGRMHDVHGPWQYQGPEEQYRLFDGIDALYHSEFGAEGAANLYTLRRFISPQYEFPPDATNPAWVHHGSWWLHRDKLEALFGTLDRLEIFVRASQWMHAEGLRYAIEANRRRKWRCSGTSPWQFNEAFPNTACTNSVDYLGLPKPVYWWVRRAYEPVHISAQYDRITWQPGEQWHCEVWVNNSHEATSAARWTAELMTLSGEMITRADGSLDLPENAATKVTELAQQLPQAPVVCLLLLSLFDAGGQILSHNEYMFSTAQPPMQPMLNAPETTLSVWHRHGELRVRNIGNTPALFVQIEPANGQWILPPDDYFCLMPGEVRSMQLAGQGNVLLRAWNSRPHRIRLS